VPQSAEVPIIRRVGVTPRWAREIQIRPMDFTLRWTGGRQAKARHRGAYVWADMTNANFPSTAIPV